jgi:hypothetical protein
MPFFGSSWLEDSDRSGDSEYWESKVSQVQSRATSAEAEVVITELDWLTTMNSWHRLKRHLNSNILINYYYEEQGKETQSN